MEVYRGIFGRFGFLFGRKPGYFTGEKASTGIGENIADII
jgi:hypothetical protein